MKIPHLDFLPFARLIWKNTYESRRLGYLGETLLGISREDDIDGSLIPSLYFSYLRSGNPGLLENVIEHNALDIVGLSSLLLLAATYCEDVSLTTDEGEVLGVGLLYERAGCFDRAEKVFNMLRGAEIRKEINFKAVKKLAMLKKKKQLIKEAAELWEAISESSDHQVIRELSIHYEHREKNFFHAIEIVEKGLTVPSLTEKQRAGLEKRLLRLKKKIEKLNTDKTTSSM